MASRPFFVTPPATVTSSVSLAPVYNALTSLSLLHTPYALQEVDVWVAETAAALTPAQRERNRLVFEGLGEALMTDRDWPDFPAYLDDLAAREPIALRDRMIERLCRTPRADPERDGSQALETPADLLADPAAFQAQIRRVYPNDPLDPALLAQVHALLDDPRAMHDLIVSHLRELWETYLAAEWQRKRNFLEWMVRWLGEREWPHTSAVETIRAFIGRDVPPAIAGQLEGVRHVIFVLSSHLGPYATRFGSETTIWVFVRGRKEDLPLRQAPIKRVELIGPFAALADETRLRMLELLAQNGELLAQDLIPRLDLSQPSISRHLKQLTSTGFVTERRGTGANKSYRLNPARIDWTFAALRQVLDGNERLAVPDARTEQPLDLRRFLDTAGRVKSWPSRSKDQQIVLAYLAAHFERGREYSEKEVNAILNAWHSYGDHATLRRYLYDHRYLDRSRDGARYWLGSTVEAGAAAVEAAE